MRLFAKRRVLALGAGDEEGGDIGRADVVKVAGDAERFCGPLPADLVRVHLLLNSEPHPDHAGELAVLQQASGAQLWASEASADSLAAGGGISQRSHTLEPTLASLGRER